MGHFFRALNLIAYLSEQQQLFVVLINDYDKSKSILENINIPFEVVDLGDFSSNWEAILIAKYGITVWINDRLNTNILHSQRVKQSNTK